jgi:hypothetical protein
LSVGPRQIGLMSAEGGQRTGTENSSVAAPTSIQGCAAFLGTPDENHVDRMVWVAGKPFRGMTIRKTSEEAQAVAAPSLFQDLHREKTGNKQYGTGNDKRPG